MPSTPIPAQNLNGYMPLEVRFATHPNLLPDSCLNIFFKLSKRSHEPVEVVFSPIVNAMNAEYKEICTYTGLYHDIHRCLYVSKSPNTTYVFSAIIVVATVLLLLLSQQKSMRWSWTMSDATGTQCTGSQRTTNGTKKPGLRSAMRLKLSGYLSRNFGSRLFSNRRWSNGTQFF